jgi:hypothetical protein
MSQKHSSSDSISSYEPEPEVAVVSRDGSHLEAAIDGQMFYCSLLTIHGRMAARVYAYSIAGEDPKVARAILAVVGKEG